MKSEGVMLSLPRVNSDIANNARLIAVIDTNYFIDHLSLIRGLAEQALEHGLVLVVPWVVLQELDGLKASFRVAGGGGNSPTDVGTLARSATRFLDEELGREGSALRCQKRSEYLINEVENDDKILDCCLYFMEKRGLPVAILTKDRNLTVKARANGCVTCGKWTDSVSGLISTLTSTAALPSQPMLHVASNQLQPPPLPAETQVYVDDNDCMDIDMDTEPDHISYPDSNQPLHYGADVRTPSQISTPVVLPPTSNPVLIYIDELSESEEARNSLTGQKAAHTISQEIIAYMCDSKLCALTTLVTGRLEKDAMISYKSTASTTKRAFASPPWTSGTTLLTIIIYYWDVFRHVFPKGVKDSIKSALPWVMHVEGVTQCPQTQLSLPPYLRFEPYKYSIESDNVFENLRNQGGERNSETAKLVALAKPLLAQCALVETDEQEALREKITQRWVTWFKINQ
ncbi:hypothetical protein IW147_000499 [Coemansia sp. RSA 720]|nr:hypothetical protein IW147_000499 [Coemansia sp. RSA 720]